MIILLFRICACPALPCPALSLSPLFPPLQAGRPRKGIHPGTLGVRTYVPRILHRTNQTPSRLCLTSPPLMPNTPYHTSYQAPSRTVHANPANHPSPYVNAKAYLGTKIPSVHRITHQTPYARLVDPPFSVFREVP